MPQRQKHDIRQVESSPKKLSTSNKPAQFGKNSRIGLIGAGAIGGPVAASMIEAGYDVQILVRRKEQQKKIENENLIIINPDREFSVVAKPKSSIQQFKGPFDILFLATKVTEIEKLPAQLKTLLKKDGIIVSLQNGNVLDLLDKKFSSHRVAGCVVGWGSTMQSDNRIEVTSGGDFFIGMRENVNEPALLAVQQMLNCTLPCEITDNIEGHLYGKIIINSCITSLGAICGLYLGDMLSKKLMRNLFIEIMFEAMQVANAYGIKVESVNKRLDFYEFTKSQSWFSELKRHILIRMVGFKYRRLKSSSLQSLERGLPTEIDYLNGYIARLAEKKKIRVPVNKRVTEIIHEIEQGKRQIGLINFYDPVFSPFHKKRPINRMIQEAGAIQ